MKKLSIFLLLIILFSLTSCSAINTTKKTSKEVTTTEYIEPIDVYSFHTDNQESYLLDKYENFALYARGVEELSIPNKIEIKIGNDYRSYTVILSEHEDLSDSITIKTKNNKLELLNLKMNTVYYYTVDESEVYKFKTDSKGPRNLSVDGVTNIRDVGGWNGSNQGLIYRSSKFNKDESDELIITDKGIDTLVNELGIKTEIDLRKEVENGDITLSPLGFKINYIHIPMQSGGNILTLNKEKLKDLFEVFGDESNYPIVFHCSIGTDRTGLVAFLINGLLGVKEEDLYRDYLFSNFGVIGKMRTPSSIKDYITVLNNFSSGDTLKEKIYNYLVDNGVDKNDIDTLIKIMGK